MERALIRACKEFKGIEGGSEREGKREEVDEEERPRAGVYCC